MAEVIQPETLRVEVELEELDGTRRELAVRVPPEPAERVRERYVRRFASQAKLKGFRKGKAPAQLVEQKYGDEIGQEVLKDLLREGYQSALAQEELEPVAPPEISDVRWLPDGSLEFTATLDVEPEITLDRVTGFRVEETVREVSEEDVDRVLERLRTDRADWRPVDRPAREGDRVVFDSVPLDDEGEPMESERVENHQVELGSGSLLPDFEEGLEGLEPGERTDLEVGFPEDHPNEELRGRTRTFRVEVDAVKERELPGLDAAFAGEVGEFDSVEELRSHVRGNLEEEIAQQSRREVNEAIIDQIIEANRIEVPETMVDRYLANMMSDRRGPMEGRVPPEKSDEVREVLRPGAERAIRRHYILKHVAESEGLEVEEEELEAALAERIDTEEMSVNDARRRLERSGDLDDLRFHLKMEKVFDWLRERSEIEPVPAENR
ncbi:MAG: trigger factor [Gemmatimonadota bacterium]|nr:trigger factor [Gemmatimonadota bacterium]